MVFKKKNSKLTRSEKDNIRKNARYDILKMVIEKYPQNKLVEMKLEAKVKANGISQRSHPYYLLWLKFMLEEGEIIDTSWLEQELLQVIEENYGDNTRDYREALQELVDLTMTATGMFKEEKIEEAIELVYTKSQPMEEVHKKSINEMKKCLQLIL